MGAGASFEPMSAAESQRRFYCHACHKIFTRDREETDRESSAVPSTSNQISSGLSASNDTHGSEPSSAVERSSSPSASNDLTCIYCQSSFIEEMDTRTQSSAIPRQNLSEEQSRRLANAAFMLRVLETQLRDELDALQTMYAQQRQQRDLTEKNRLTETMRDKLRHTHLDVDMICSLPKCPICSEDYQERCQVIQLPCNHFFHEICVVPWLDMKLTCPICRYEMNDELPSIEELLRFSDQELVDRLKDMPGAEEVDFKVSTKKELASLLRDYISDRKQQRVSKEISTTSPTPLHRGPGSSSSQSFMVLMSPLNSSNNNNNININNNSESIISNNTNSNGLGLGLMSNHYLLSEEYDDDEEDLFMHRYTSHSHPPLHPLHPLQHYHHHQQHSHHNPNLYHHLHLHNSSGPRGPSLLSQGDPSATGTSPTFGTSSSSSSSGVSGVSGRSAQHRFPFRHILGDFDDDEFLLDTAHNNPYNNNYNISNSHSSGYNYNGFGHGSNYENSYGNNMGASSGDALSLSLMRTLLGANPNPIPNPNPSSALTTSGTYMIRSEGRNSSLVSSVSPTTGTSSVGPIRDRDGSSDGKEED